MFKTSTPSLLPYRVQCLFESPGHAGDQVDVVVYAAAHAALHQCANRRLLGSRVKQILGLVIAMHCTSLETILKTRKTHVHLAIMQTQLTHGFEHYKDTKWGSKSPASSLRQERVTSSPETSPARRSPAPGHGPKECDTYRCIDGPGTWSLNSCYNSPHCS